jgi:hypothetical protein
VVNAGVYRIGLLALVVGVGACSSGGGKQSAPTASTTASTGPAATTVIKAPFTPVAVSATCQDAMRTLVLMSGGGLDPFAKGPPSGMGAQFYESKVADTLTHCDSKDEWLTAAQESMAPTNSNDYSAGILQSDCGDRFTDRPRVIPLDAPTCVSGSASASIVASLGPCPPTPPVESLKSLNARVRGLGRRLVPFDVVGVRICRYGLDSVSDTARGTLDGVGALSGPVARDVEHELNSLRSVQEQAIAESPTGPLCAGPLYVTFASGSQTLTVTVTGCDVVTNGVFLAFGTDVLLNDLDNYTADLPVTSLIAKGPTGPAG